jgi:hypothetical protein
MPTQADLAADLAPEPSYRTKHGDAEKRQSRRLRNRKAAATGRAASAGVSGEGAASDEHKSGNQNGSTTDIQSTVWHAEFPSRCRRM